MWRVTGKIVSCIPPQLNYFGEITIEGEDRVARRYKVRLPEYTQLCALYKGEHAGKKIAFNVNGHDEIEVVGKA